MYKKMFKKIKINKGYTLLFAVIVASIVLSVGISILNINKKEFLLAASARDSTYAFYAANSGLECAVFHDQNGDKFSTASLNLNGIQCAGNGGVGNKSVVTSGGGMNYSQTVEFNLKLPNGACAIVDVKKSYYNDPIAGWVDLTTIDSRGYNKGWSIHANSCIDVSPDRVERAIHYEK